VDSERSEERVDFTMVFFFPPHTLYRAVKSLCNYASLKTGNWPETPLYLKHQSWKFVCLENYDPEIKKFQERKLENCTRHLNE